MKKKQIINKNTNECAKLILKIVESESQIADGIVRTYMKQIGKLAKTIIENEKEAFGTLKLKYELRCYQDNKREINEKIEW